MSTEQGLQARTTKELEASWLSWRDRIMQQGLEARYGFEIANPFKEASTCSGQAKDLGLQVWHEFWGLTRNNLAVRALEMRKNGDRSVHLNLVKPPNLVGERGLLRLYIVLDRVDDAPLVGHLAIRDLKKIVGGRLAFAELVGEPELLHPSVQQSELARARSLTKFPH